jgi:hypothetical protein
MLRLRYFFLALLTIALGLAVHLTAAALPRAPRDILGDALWAMLIVWLLALIAPTVERRVLGVGALLVCFTVEFGQLIRYEWLADLRRTTVGHFVLGSDFDARDLVAYGAGIIAALLIDRWGLRLRRSGAG